MADTLSIAMPDPTPSREVPAEARAAIRETVQKMKEAWETPDAEFGGHKGIYLANLEGSLARYTGALLDALEATEDDLASFKERVREALEALEVAALGAYEEKLMPEDTVANPYEERGLVKVTQDYSGDYSCHWTPEGIEFVRETIEKLRAALDTPEADRGREEAVEARVREELLEALTGDDSVFAWPRGGNSLLMDKDSLAGGVRRAFAALKPNGAEEER